MGCQRENEVFCSRVIPYVDAMAVTQLAPQLITVHVVSYPTCLGDEYLVIFPRPSCPEALFPQDHKVPSVLIAN